MAPLYHWAISPKDKWVLFDVKKDPQCENDLADQRPGLVARLDKAYSKWWDDTYPEMIAMGGDAGNPTRDARQPRKAPAGKVRPPTRSSLLLLGSPI